MATVEDRLRRELQRSPASGPNPAALVEIERRAAARALGQADGEHSPRGSYLLTMAAATIAVVGTIAALTRNDDAVTVRTEPDDGVSGIAVTAPSWLWLLVVIAVGAALITPARRLRAGRLASVAVGLATVAVVVALAAMLSSWHAGERVSASPPMLPGYEVTDAGLNWWPWLGDYEQIRFTYRTVDGRPIAGSPAAESTLLDQLGDELGFDSGLPNLGRPCLRVQAGGPGAADVDLTPLQQLRSADHYCLAAVGGNSLEVTGTEYSTNWLWFRRLVSAPLLWLAAILGALALADQRRTEPPRTTRNQLVYGLVVLLSTTVLFMMGIFAIDAVRVGRIDGIRDCSGGTITTDDGSLTCREYVTELVAEHGLTASASRLYGPLMVVAGMAAFVLGAVVSILVVGLAVSRDGLPTFRKRLLAVILVLTVASVAVQLAHADTIEVTTNAYD